MKYSIAIALTLAAPLAAMAQVTVFSDNFGTSTVQSATPGAGTGSSADYEVFTATAAPTGATITANDLHFGTTSTTSTFGEVQARFGGSPSPITLSTIGDAITLNLTFVDTANVMIAAQNSNASLNIGLFNSSGVNLNTGGLLGAVNTTGGAQNYQGYVSRLFMNGNASSFNRASQTPDGTTSRNQDLLFNNASGSSSFGAPNGTTTTSTFGTTTPLGNNVGLTQGNTYTISYTISLTAANAVKVEDKLFAGSLPTGTALQDNGGTSTSGAFLGSSFDSLAFGYRYASATSASAGLDINNINVIFTPAPEPTTLALSAFGGLGLLAVRRWKNRK